MAYTLMIIIAFIMYCATSLLGIGITLRWWRTHTIRWLHHTLFGGIWASVGLAALVAFLSSAVYWYAPLAVLLWMAPLPLVRAGRFGHQALAAGGFVTFLAVLAISRL